MRWWSTGTGLDTAVGLRHGLSQAESTCVTCGQCVLVCPTGALGERDETDRVLDYLFDPEIVTVFQFAPAVRVGFGEEFGFPVGTNVEGQIIAALRQLGADIVLDTNFAADVVIMEESAELLRRLGDGRRPTFTSCCPAWINFAERHYPDLLPLLSSTKSPQQCLGVDRQDLSAGAHGHRSRAHPGRSPSCPAWPRRTNAHDRSWERATCGRWIWC